MSNLRPNVSPQTVPWTRSIDAAVSALSSVVTNLEVWARSSVRTLTKSVVDLQKSVGVYVPTTEVTSFTAANTSPGARGATYTKRSGLVYVNVQVSRVAGTEVGTLFVLPQGCRPATNAGTLAQSSGVVRCEVTVGSDGTVSLLNNVSSSTSIVFSLVFAADN